MKASDIFRMTALIAGAAITAFAGDNQQTLIVTASNDSNNELLVYTPTGTLLQAIPTRGRGGASGNSGGIAAQGRLLAAVNFGSSTVALFERSGDGFTLTRSIPTASSPLSVAFGNNHLYILGTTRVESHRVSGGDVSSAPDGAAALLKADGSAAQVGVVQNALVITEKSNVIETVPLDGNGAITGHATAVQNIPANVNAPFGLITRGNNAYVTIAHADEISLVRNGAVLTTTATTSFPGPVQHSPCWVALVGPFLYASNSPSSSVSRYAVYGRKIVPDEAVAASFNGSPTDIASGEGLVAVIDGNGPLSHLSIFAVDEDGKMTLQGTATIATAANGVAVVGTSGQDD